MRNTSALLFSLTVPFALSAQQEQPEIIEVLAPKQSLGSAASNSNNKYFDDRFEHTPSRTIADQLTTISGVSLNGQGGQFQSYAIRGFSRGRIRTEIDGIPIITDRRAGNSISFISPELFSSVSVIKGPSSSLYGSQALGGVVSLSTQVTDSSSIKISAQTSGNKVGVSLKHKPSSKNKHRSLALAFAYQDSNNEQAANGDELNTSFKRLSGLVRYEHQYQGYNTIFSWLPSLGKDIGKSSSRFLSREVSDYPEEIHSLAQIQVNADTGWLVKLFHHYQNWDSATLRLDQYDSLTEYQSHTLGGQWLTELTRIASTNSYLGLDWTSRKGVKIGSKYELFQASSDLNLIANQLVGEQDNLALFSKNQWQFANAQLVLSLRYDWLNQHSKGADDITEQELNASAAVNLAVNETLTMSFELANGFRYPTLSERYFNGSTPRGLVQGNQELESETSLGFETNVNWLANENLAFSGSFYFYDLDNYIKRYRINDNLLSYRNLEQADIRGFELEAIWYTSENLEQQFSYQQQNGQNQQKQTLDDLLPKQLNWSIIATFDKVQLSNSLTHYFDANEVGSSEQQRENYTLWHASVSYQVNPQQSITLVINNLTDESYFGSLDEDAPLQPERNIKLTSTWQF